jgi:hypothetical protein
MPDECKSYLDIDWGEACSSGQTTNVRIKNSNESRRIRATFILSIDVGSPPPGDFTYTVTIRPESQTNWYCANRARIESCVFLDPPERERHRRKR